MRIKSGSLHGWGLSAKEAAALQAELAPKLRARPVAIERIRTIAGVDVSAARGSDEVFAAAVVLEAGSLKMLGCSVAACGASFPYIPGLLSFREGPAALAALERLKAEPDVVIFDGQGYAHPRRLGLAAHIGLWLGVPTVGCAKSRLLGEHARIPDVKGAWVPLLHRDETIGAVLRTREGVKPVYVSRGHLCDLESAVRVVMDAVTRYRLPETTRLTHRLCNAARLG